MLTMKILLGAAALLIVIAGGVAVWTTNCPCDQRPGFFLFGEVQEAPVTDWSFVNDVPLCELQIYVGPIPYSVNLNCMATADGKLYLSCGACESRFWSRHIGENERGRLRLKGRVYPVAFTRVTDEKLLDDAWVARVKKVQVYGKPPYNPITPLGTPRFKGWGAFELRSAVS
jgi:hypothetical protein